MNYGNLQQLTEKERQMAEQYHDTIVYGFLKRHKLSIEDYYTTAVIGYLKGVQNYCRKPEIQKWALTTICGKDMLREVLNENRANKRQKRMPSGGFVSIDETFEDGNESYVNYIITPTLEDRYFEEYDREHSNDSDRVREILAPYTNLQKSIIFLMASGKPKLYILKKLHISSQQLGRELKKIRGELPNEEPIQPEITVNNIGDYIGVPTEVLLTLKLSARQLSVLNLLMVGYREADIGRELGLQRQAVYDAVRKIRKKAEKVR